MISRRTTLRISLLEGKIDLKKAKLQFQIHMVGEMGCIYDSLQGSQEGYQTSITDSWVCSPQNISFVIIARTLKRLHVFKKKNGGMNRKWIYCLRIMKRALDGGR